MTEPWIAVRIGVVESPKVLELPSDTARWGLVVLWAKAKRQRPSGVFRSEVVLRELLGRHGRFLEQYLAGGFIHRAPVECGEKRCAKAYTGLAAPSLAVHDWHLYQREHALRQLTYRLGDSPSDAESDARSDVESDTHSRALSLVNSQVSSTEGGPGETDETPLWLRAWLSVRMRMPTARQQSVIDSYLSVFDVSGPERAERVILEHPADPLGAIIADLAAFRDERKGAAVAAEQEAVARRRVERRGFRKGSVEYELAQQLYAKEGAR